MACLQLTASVLMKIMTVTVSMCVIFVLSIQTGFAATQTGYCRPFCTGSDCITVNQDRVDFQTAEEACRHRDGELMTFQSKTDLTTLNILSQELHGDFWIGLRLPAAACSNLSAPLRGYEWTSGGVQRSFTPASSTWKDSVTICSPGCVSLSKDQKWTERPCTDKAEGFLCKTKHKDACQAQELSGPKVIQSSEGCSHGPCEHTCKDVKGCYICSCYKGYIPDSKNPVRCKLHCDQQKCPAVCDRHTDSACFCPDGFVISGAFCEDINECTSNSCQHECKNTFGSFVCSCREGFVLKNQVKCVKAGSQSLVVTTPAVTGFVKLATNNRTLKGSSAPAGGFVWVWILIVVAVLVLICVIRFYAVKRQKHREQNSTQQSAAPVDNIEC
uniref:thrombomodulin-like n=1 Tax=Epinephelus lanceolatus TaxID=310571 RepID=UPI0014464037|nr:thrombomodulin-like [Epinephelus lanceolatus]